MRDIGIGDLSEAIEFQLDHWPEAKLNYARLREVRRKNFSLGDLTVGVQWNPGRIGSTSAKVDSKSISQRKCFLCKSNRSQYQLSIDFDADWEMLVNPFPILPVHLTIADKLHRPQGRLPLALAEMAENVPGLTFFYNGARAGASAPDHRHAQAVLSEELPLWKLITDRHHSEVSDIKTSIDLRLNVPFQFVSAIVHNDDKGYEILRKVQNSFGIDAETGDTDFGLINAFFGLDEEGVLRIVIVPRRRHRPSCYYSEGDSNYMVSPGSIDMAGLIITPRLEDFERIESDTIRSIYADTAFAKELPKSIYCHFHELDK